MGVGGGGSGAGLGLGEPAPGIDAQGELGVCGDVACSVVAELHAGIGDALQPVAGGLGGVGAGGGGGGGRCACAGLHLGAVAGGDGISGANGRSFEA